jgi:hypothetical protein
VLFSVDSIPQYHQYAVVETSRRRRHPLVQRYIATGKADLGPAGTSHTSHSQRQRKQQQRDVGPGRLGVEEPDGFLPLLLRYQLQTVGGHRGLFHANDRHQGVDIRIETRREIPVDPIDMQSDRKLCRLEPPVLCLEQIERDTDNLGSTRPVVRTVRQNLQGRDAARMSGDSNLEVRFWVSNGGQTDDRCRREPLRVVGFELVAYLQITQPPASVVVVATRPVERKENIATFLEKIEKERYHVQKLLPFDQQMGICQCNLFETIVGAINKPLSRFSPRREM